MNKMYSFYLDICAEELLPKEMENCNAQTDREGKKTESFGWREEERRHTFSSFITFLKGNNITTKAHKTLLPRLTVNRKLKESISSHPYSHTELICYW